MGNVLQRKFVILSLLLLVMPLAGASAFAQGGGPAVPPDLVGEWRRLTNHEDAHERGPGPDPGEYWGLPLNDAARMRADTSRPTSKRVSSGATVCKAGFAALSPNTYLWTNRT